MKNLTNILIAILISSVLTACKNLPKEHKGTVEIKNSQSNRIFKADLSAHKPYDVEVFRLAIPNDTLSIDTLYTYEVIYYQVENDSLKNHGGMYASKYVYTKADYSWTNDTVSITLSSANAISPVSFRLYGKGVSNGMLDVK